MKRWLTTVGGVIMIGAGLWWLMKKEGDLLNPWGGRGERKKEQEMKVVGFLPTWMIGKTIIYKNEIDELIFLGVEAKETGELLWDIQGKKINSGSYLKMKESIKKAGGKNILGIKLFEDKKLVKLMASETARGRLIEEIKAVVTAGSFDGVNLDFEYQNDPLAALGEDFGVFLTEVRAAKMGEISVDVFANTIIKGPMEQITAFLGKVDKVIVMAYDFHRPGVDFAGPVAPIGSPVGERNIMEITEKIVLAGLDKKKIVMAYPLYGYEWKTETEELGSQVKRGWYQMISWKTAKELVESGKSNPPRRTGVESMKINWDEVSMTPWMAWKEQVQKSKIKYQKIKGKTKKVTEYYTEEEIHQAYYEDERSMEAKLQLAKQTEVGGVGFWALGYEGEDRGVWKQVSSITY